MTMPLPDVVGTGVDVETGVDVDAGTGVGAGAGADALTVIVTGAERVDADPLGAYQTFATNV